MMMTMMIMLTTEIELGINKGRKNVEMPLVGRHFDKIEHYQTPSPYRSKRPSKRAKPSAVATAVQAQLSPKSTDAACGRESITITRDDQSLSSQPFPKEQQQKQAPVLAYPGCYDDMMLIYAQMHSRAAGHGGSESRLMPRHWTAATMIDEKEL
eukprot:jgi/Bigna1/134345/aug1.24_g9053